VGTTTTIGWTDHTFNPWIGCQQVMRPECGDCYAKRITEQRMQKQVWGPIASTPRYLTTST
jgi:protein gp37